MTRAYTKQTPKGCVKDTPIVGRDGLAWTTHHFNGVHLRVTESEKETSGSMYIHILQNSRKLP